MANGFSTSLCSFALNKKFTMQHLPLYVYITFGATVLFAIWLFYKATNYSKQFLILLVSWLIVQSFLSIEGFYSDPDNMTARFPLLVLPPLFFLALNFITKKGRSFVDSLNLPMLTIFHVIRIPVEIVLFWLYMNKSIPEAMTFHGKNFDILSGITAPFVYYFGFVKKKLSNTAIIIWNLICLALLLNVVSNAILSLPARYKNFGFEQPNIGLEYFPFALLPACLVPLVLFATLATLKQLSKKAEKNNFKQKVFGDQFKTM
jgi:hypothetical protein